LHENKKIVKRSKIKNIFRIVESIGYIAQTHKYMPFLQKIPPAGQHDNFIEKQLSLGQSN
jgi:hypothetical protein